jgi:hypothetical protein
MASYSESKEQGNSSKWIQLMQSSTRLSQTAWIKQKESTTGDRRSQRIQQGKTMAEPTLKLATNEENEDDTDFDKEEKTYVMHGTKSERRSR